MAGGFTTAIGLKMAQPDRQVITLAGMAVLPC